MPKGSGRRARLVVLEPAATQIRALESDPAALARLEAALDTIVAQPDEAPVHATVAALRDFRAGGVRVIYYATALGSIVIVTYVEVD
ncbi:hypothetical protein [Streptomyces sp. NPDC053560]|uniref:hypothetical protein n=1 Tax=Streptomyces sp. NPDC053560 TaxID=3365711 RepID=UPI0037D4A841